MGKGQGKGGDAGAVKSERGNWLLKTIRTFSTSSTSELVERKVDVSSYKITHRKGKISLAEVKEHNSAESCWVAIKGKVRKFQLYEYAFWMAALHVGVQTAPQ